MGGINDRSSLRNHAEIQLAGPPPAVVEKATEKKPKEPLPESATVDVDAAPVV